MRNDISWTKVVIAFSMLLGSFLYFVSDANAYEVPSDAVIKVFDKSGKQIGEMSRSEYKVVKIETSEAVIAERKKNYEYRRSHDSFIFHVGIGKDGLNDGHDGTNFTVREKKSAVFGLTYCHSKKEYGLCATGLTNSSFLLGVKKDF